MLLGDKQRLFTRLVGLLIEFAYQSGYELTFGEVKRSADEAVKNAASGDGIVNSLHKLSLAVDFNLFKDGQYLKLSEDHHELGVFWEGLHPLCKWGGRFKKVDGNHYSLEHEGVQ